MSIPPCNNGRGCRPTSEGDLHADIDEDEEGHEVHRALPEHRLVLAAALVRLGVRVVDDELAYLSEARCADRTWARRGDINASDYMRAYSSDVLS